MQLLLIALATAAQAATPPPPEKLEELPEVRVTCRTERVTGTRVVKRICRTPEQQKLSDEQARLKMRMNSQVQTAGAFKRPTGE